VKGERDEWKSQCTNKLDPYIKEKCMEGQNYKKISRSQRKNVTAFNKIYDVYSTIFNCNGS